jgi:hypothetical protein
MDKKLIALGIIVFILAATACSKKTEAPASPPTSAGQTEIKPDVVSQTEITTGAAPNRFHKTLIGTLDARLDIEMELDRNNQQITGSYFYANVRDYIELQGTVAKDGSAKIEELTGGKKTGAFKGKLSNEERNGVVSLRFEGTWSNAKGDKQMPVSLREQSFALSNGLRIVTKSLKDENKKEHYEIEADYPQIEGSSEAPVADFNKAVQTIINDNVRTFKKDAPEAYDKDSPDAQLSGLVINHNLAMANDSVISVSFNISTYFSGAAHPNHNSYALNYDLRNGKELQLRDLFQPGANFLQAISNYSIKSLKTRLKKLEMDDDSLIQEGAGASADNFQSWNLTAKGLLITFDPYQVAAYAAGPQEVLIPYANLKDLLKADSPAGQLMALESLSK